MRHYSTKAKRAIITSNSKMSLLRETIRGFLLEYAADSSSTSIDDSLKKAQELISSNVEEAQIARAAAQKNLGAKNKLTAALDKREKIWLAIADAAVEGISFEGKKDKIRALRKELKSADENVISAAQDDMSSYDEWVSAMKDAGVEVPSTVRKSLEDEHERYRKQHGEDEEYLDKAEQELEKHAQAQRSAQEKMEKLLADIESKNAQKGAKAKSANDKIKQDRENMIKSYVADMEKMLGELRGMLSDSKDVEYASKEEQQAYEEIIVPYMYDEAEEIRKQELDINEELATLMSQGTKKEILDFQNNTFKPFYKNVVAPYYKKVVPVWVKFFKTVRGQGKEISKDNIEHMIKLLEIEIKYKNKDALRLQQSA